MKKSLIAASLGLILGSSIALTAFAQAKPDTLVKQRQAAMTLQGKYFYGLGPMAQGKAPFDAAVFARNAGYLDSLTKMAWDGFTPNTSGEKSRALPEIYSDPAKWKQAQDSFQVEVGKFVAATKGGNEQAIKAAWSDVNKSCGGCHESFRSK